MKRSLARVIHNIDDDDDDNNNAWQPPRRRNGRRRPIDGNVLKTVCFFFFLFPFSFHFGREGINNTTKSYRVLETKYSGIQFCGPLMIGCP